jgi:flagellar hook-basal body complex protein FliE
MDTPGINQLLNELAATARVARGEAAQPAAPGADFAGLLKTTLDQVNAAQQQATDLTQAFERGAPDVKLEDVMMSLQKANLSFQTLVQVRNKMVSAYQEIINMQV